MMQVPDKVSVYEVSPRDGLQNEKATVPLDETRFDLSTRCTAAGLRRIEVDELRLAEVDSAARRRRRRGRALPRIAAGRA